MEETPLFTIDLEDTYCQMLHAIACCNSLCLGSREWALIARSRESILVSTTNCHGSVGVGFRHIEGTVRIWKYENGSAETAQMEPCLSLITCMNHNPLQYLGRGLD
jgi:hypothetical protein